MNETNTLPNKNIIISNYLVRSAQTLTLSEKRILFLGIAKLNGKNGEVKISAQEYATTFDLHQDTAYTQLKDAAENLLSRKLSWQVKDGSKIGNLRCLWLQGYKYFQNEGFVTYRFSEYVFPFLFELQKEFTKYQLNQACALRSIHSWRLMELMEQYKNKKGNNWLQITIEEFWHAMEASKSYKNNFSLLRRWVIEAAIKELTIKDGWIIQWKPIKRGRKVVALRFDFNHNQPNYYL